MLYKTYIHVLRFQNAVFHIKMETVALFSQDGGKMGVYKG